MCMIINLYIITHPTQSLFSEKIERVSYLSQLKALDEYMFYLAYAKYCFILSKENCKLIKTLSVLIAKHKYQLEAYLILWGILTSNRKNYRDCKRANELSSGYMKNIATFKFDCNIY